MNFTFRYLRDEEVDADLDRQLRALFLHCFPREAHHLETRRYFNECPQNRWIALDENGDLAAHIAAHEKIIGAGDRDLKILGIAEVGVDPRFRGQGLVKTLLQQVHQWGQERGFLFAALGGAAGIYSSSGYVNVYNPTVFLDMATGQNVVEVKKYIMVRPLSEMEWPEGEIDFHGPTF